MLVRSLSGIGYLLQENVTCADSEYSQRAPVPWKLFDEGLNADNAEVESYDGLTANSLDILFSRARPSFDP